MKAISGGCLLQPSLKYITVSVSCQFQKNSPTSLLLFTFPTVLFPSLLLTVLPSPSTATHCEGSASLCTMFFTSIVFVCVCDTKKTRKMITTFLKKSLILTLPIIYYNNSITNSYACQWNVKKKILFGKYK